MRLLDYVAKGCLLVEKDLLLDNAKGNVSFMRVCTLLSIALAYAFYSQKLSAQVILPPLQQSIIAIEGSPEGRYAYDVGIVVVDVVTGKLYSKRTTRDRNTGWVEFTTGAATAGLTYSFSPQFTTTGVTNVAIASGASITNANLVTAVSVAIGSTNVVGALSTKAEITSQTFITPDIGVATATTLNTGFGANELYAMDQNVLTTSTPQYAGIGLGLAAVSGQIFTLQKSSIGTSPTGSLFLTNNTPAALGAQQYSPSFVQTGNGWGTTASTSQPISVRTYVVPVQGTTPGLTWTVDGSINSAAYSTLLSYNNLSGLTSAGSVTASGSSGFVIAGKSFFSSAANGDMIVRNNAGTTISTFRGNEATLTKTANYTILVLDSGYQFNNIGAVATNRLDLPTAAAGMQFEFYVDAAFNMQMQATGTDVIRDGGVVSAAAGDIHSLVVGSYLSLVCPKTGLWVVRYKNGTWVGPQ